jgi:hypothetical protein
LPVYTTNPKTHLVLISFEPLRSNWFSESGYSSLKAIGVCKLFSNNISFYNFKYPLNSYNSAFGSSHSQDPTIMG